MVRVRIRRPHRRVLGSLVVLAGVGGFVAIAASCLSDIKDTLPPGINVPPPDGPPPSSRDGGFLCSPTAGYCCPTDPTCYPPPNLIDNPSGSGAECLATRDNTKQDHWQFRTVWGWTPKPDLGSTAQADAFIFVKNQLPEPNCNFPSGTSGYIQLTDLDRSDPTPTNHVGKVGYAAYVDPTGVADALKTGLCMMNFSYQEPHYAALDPKTPTINVQPSTAHRVMADFIVNDAFRAMYKDADQGVFYLDETTGRMHSYGGTAYVVLWESATNIDVITVHENEVLTVLNDPAHPNCVGRYRGEALDPNTSCATGQTSAFSSPAFGCVNEAMGDVDAGVANLIDAGPSTTCLPGGGQSLTKGYFLIEELDYVYLSIATQSLLVNYYGPSKAQMEGWIPSTTTSFHENAMWLGGARPKGDWCSKTNAPADASCSDALQSIAIQNLAAVNVSATACPAPAPGYM